METRDHARAYVTGVVRKTIMKPSHRGQQASVGPSDISDPCDLCLASALSRRGPTALGQGRHEGFSLKAWSGTAVHTKLETDIDLPDGHVITEQRVFIHHIPGYGDVHGHIDVQFPRMGTFGDYKTTDMAKLKGYKVNGVPLRHAGQIMMYGFGLRLMGSPAETAALIYIPRDSNNINDIWVATADYHEGIAVKALKRVDDIWLKVSNGYTDFDSHPDCYVCKTALFSMLGR